MESDETEPDDPKRRSPGDVYAGFEPGPLAIAPDGGIAPGPIGTSAPVPAATPETFICLRGPCRHYWVMETFFESGNPKETWDSEVGLKDADGKPVRQPHQITRSCLAHPGTIEELTEDAVFECNKFDPLSPRELKKRQKRIDGYFKRYPQHRPKGT